MRYIQQNKPKIIEGKVRAEELRTYLESFNLPLAVWLSEDASGIVPKVDYDGTTNLIVGKVLPIDEGTGFPIERSYKARSAEEIENHVNDESINKSTLMYIIVAQPLKPNVPPFILSIFGTNNKFTTDHVLKRWQFIQKELARYVV